MSVYVASPETPENLWDGVRGAPRPFASELQMFAEAGYLRVGDYLVPGR